MPGDLGDLSDLSIGLKMNEAGGIGKMKKRNTADRRSKGLTFKVSGALCGYGIGD